MIQLYHIGLDSKTGDIMRNKQTERLLERLKNIKSQHELKEYLELSKSKGDPFKLSEYILELCTARGLKKNEIIRNADIYRTYGYEILNGKKLPSRDKLLQICIGNEFSLDEANRCLTIGKLGILYAKDPRDSIIIYALNNNLNLIATNIILDEHDFILLGTF